MLRVHAEALVGLHCEVCIYWLIMHAILLGHPFQWHAHRLAARVDQAWCQPVQSSYHCSGRQGFLGCRGCQPFGRLSMPCIVHDECRCGQLWYSGVLSRVTPLFRHA